MKETVIFLIALLLSAVSLHAQQILLSGNVVDASDNSPLHNVIVLIRNAKGNIITHIQTDNEGAFSLTLSEEIASQCADIQFSLMSYKKQTYPLNGKSQEFHISLEQTVIQIKEVIVKGQRIGEQGDTLTYNVASFANEQDRSIGDVLRKMPGIHVDKEGKIKYNGVGINKFYIEGKDLLEGRYGIATEGISYKDVSRVEVMENHQPIKVMAGFTYSDKAAINLKLKKEAKAQWIGNVKLQGGYAEKENGLWYMDALGMMINKKLQNITTLKSNNTGDNIKKNVKKFYNDRFINISGLDEYIRIGSNQISDLEENRTLFNRTHLFSSSQLWEVGKEWQLKTQIDYLNNHETNQDKVQTSYFMPNGIEIFIEDEQQKQQQNLMSASAIQEKNSSHTYLKHTLSMDLQWNSTHVQTDGTYPNRQETELPIYKLKSNLNWVQRFNKQLVTFTAYNLLHSSPQDFRVKQEGQQLCQSINIKAFYTNENASYNLAFGKFILSLKGGIAGLRRSMGSELTGVSDSLGWMTNDIKSNYLQFYVSPQIQYSSSGWDISLSAITQYYLYNFGKQMDKRNDVLFSPKLYIRWIVNSHLNMNISGNIYPQSYDIGHCFNGLILTNYHTLKKGYDSYSTSSDKSVTGGIYYKHSLNEFFLNLSVLRSWNSSPFQNEQRFVDRFILYSYKRQSVSSNSWLIMGNVSKGIGFLKGIVNLDANYIGSKTSLLAENVPVTYHSTAGNVGLDVNGQFFSWIDWYYQAKYNFSCLESNVQEREKLDNWQHTLNLDFLFNKRIIFTLSGEYYHNEISPNMYKNLLIGDIQFIYKWKDWEFSAQVRNLLNKEEYGYNIHNELTTISCLQRMRGREFLLGFSWRCNQ